MHSGIEGTKRRRLFRRKDRTALPPVSLSPDEWIASLMDAPRLAVLDHGREQAAPLHAHAAPEGRVTTTTTLIGGNGNGHAQGARHAPEPAGSGAVPSEPGGQQQPPRRRRRVWRVLVGLVVVLGLAGSGAVAAVSIRDRLAAEDQVGQLRARLDAARGRVAALTTERDALRSEAAADEPKVLALEAELARANAELQALQQRIKEQEAVPADLGLAPNGKKISVELTGYEDVLVIHDVHLTQSYGFSDLIGIAVNQTDEEIPYAQLGCTFLDAKGRVLANVIDNREHWPAGASWGFDCSAEVDATGGIVRVDSAG